MPLLTGFKPHRCSECGETFETFCCPNCNKTESELRLQRAQAQRDGDGCPRNRLGEFVGARCDAYAGCYYETNHGERGCGCCYIHCLCQPEEEEKEKEE